MSTELSAVECRNCGALMELDSHARTSTCPYCALPSVVERPATRNRPRPRFALGFVVTRDRARDHARDWARSLGFFKPSALRNAALDDLRGVYLPAYLYSAAARSRWSAQIGENYTEIETYTVTNARGERETRTRTVTRTEYWTLRGNHVTFVSDVLVTASKAMPNDELEHIEPFDLRLLRRYEPALVSGWIAEDPSLTPAQCFELARDEAVTRVGAALADFMPGDSYQGLRYETSFEQESIDLALVPVWVLAVRYAPDKPPLRVSVNGQTGRVFGHAPTDWGRVTAVALLVLLLVLAAFAYSQHASGAL